MGKTNYAKKRKNKEEMESTAAEQTKNGSNTYKVTNLVTGKTRIGKAIEISKITGIKPGCAYSYASQGVIFKEIWKIEFVSRRMDDATEKKSIPSELCKIWDREMPGIRKRLLELYGVPKKARKI